MDTWIGSESNKNSNWLIYGILAVGVFYLLFHKVLKRGVVKPGVIEDGDNKPVSKKPGLLLFS